MGKYQVDVRCLKFLQAGFKRSMQALRTVPTSVDDELLLAKTLAVGRGVFSCNNHPITISTLLHPVAD